jgi:hypothetical protein
MRAVAACLLVLTLLAAEAIPHAYVHAIGGDECAVCVLGHSAPAASAQPDVAPQVVVADEVVCAPGLPPVSGAPLGAVPGQSPPVAV